MKLPASLLKGRWLSLTFILLFGLGPLAELQAAQTDDFDDGNDQGWVRYNPFASAGANIVNWTLAEGSYRIRTTAPSPAAALGPGRAGSLRSEIYTDFYLEVDLVGWNNDLPQAAGLLARVRNAGLGTTSGYAFTWSRGNVTSQTSGTVDISVITNEGPSDVSTVGASGIHLEPGRSYRMVFLGIGSHLEGRIYEHPDLETPRVSIVGTNEAYASGAGGLVIYDNSTGGTNVCDVTFDNFFAQAREPVRLRMRSLDFQDWEVSWPVTAEGYVLQTSTTLSPPSWEDVPPFSIFIIGDRYTFAFNSTGDTNLRLFRLAKP